MSVDQSATSGAPVPPELEYRYTCVEGDAARFTRNAMTRWVTRNRALWITMAIYLVLMAFASWALAHWWPMLVVPAMFIFFAAVTYSRVSRANRRYGAPGTEMAAGYSDSAFRLADGGVDISVAYARIEKVERYRGDLLIKIRKGRWFQIPAANAPAEVEAKLRAAITA